MKSKINPAVSVLNAVECFSSGFTQMQDAMAQPAMRAVLNGAADLIYNMNFTKRTS